MFFKYILDYVCYAMPWEALFVHTYASLASGLCLGDSEQRAWQAPAFKRFWVGAPRSVPEAGVGQSARKSVPDKVFLKCFLKCLKKCARYGFKRILN